MAKQLIDSGVSSRKSDLGEIEDLSSDPSRRCRWSFASRGTRTEPSARRWLRSRPIPGGCHKGPGDSLSTGPRASSQTGDLCPAGTK